VGYDNIKKDDEKKRHGSLNFLTVTLRENFLFADPVYAGRDLWTALETSQSCFYTNINRSATRGRTATPSDILSMQLEAIFLGAVRRLMKL
jgi:hypothetical protein